VLTVKTPLTIIVLSTLTLIAVASGASGQNNQEPPDTVRSGQADDLNHNALASLSVAHQQVISLNLDVINKNLPVVSAQIDRKLEEMMI